jgi:hypothetical protein
MSKEYIFTYQTKNLINGKTYIGVHSTNNLDDGYIGNGIVSNGTNDSQLKAGRYRPFVMAVKKYGYENFKIEILSFFDTLEEVYEEEAFLVDYKWVKSQDNYNVALGGYYNKKPYRLYEFSDDINKMYSDINISYSDINKKYNATKGSWIGLLIESSKLKRKNSSKKSFYNGIEVINKSGEEHKLYNEEIFFKQTGLNKKTIHELNKEGYCKGWYLKNSEKYQEYKNHLFYENKILNQINNQDTINNSNEIHKKCCNCKMYFSLDLFCNHYKGKYGKDHRCKPCSRKRSRLRNLLKK